MKPKFKTRIVLSATDVPAGYAKLAGYPIAVRNRLGMAHCRGAIPSVKVMAHTSDVTGAVWLEKSAADAYLAALDEASKVIPLPTVEAQDLPEPAVEAQGKLSLDPSEVCALLTRIADTQDRTAVAVANLASSMLRLEAIWSGAAKVA